MTARCTRARARAGLAAALVAGASLACATAPAPRPPAGPSLPLPALEATDLEGWPADRPVSHARRAWHYRPELVAHIGGASKTVMTASSLTPRARAMLFAVVAARNRCFY